jgi:hypothetical protein
MAALPPLALQMIVAGVLAAGLLVIWRRRGPDFDRRVFAAACLVSLLSVRHLSYDLLLAIPALAFALSHGSRAARALGGVALAVFVASPPSVWRHYVEPRFIETPLDAVAMHAYRIVAVCLLLLVVAAPASPREARSTI